MIALRLLLMFSFTMLSLRVSCADDWRMWRYDALRRAATPDGITEDLQLLWKREMPPTRPAWPKSQKRLQFDRGYEPIVMGNQLFTGSSYDDSLTAYSTETGEQKWKFFAEAPIRFAPVANKGRLYVASDDGFLYCLNAITGKEIWKVRGGPSDRKILGNGRLISTWPARGAPVLSEGVVYFAASIWPSMGTFIHAVDAQSGKIIWTNSKTGSQFIKQPHRGAISFGSIAPQGYLVVNGENLIVPGGRSKPAVFNKKTGELKYFQYEQKKGGTNVVSAGQFFFVENDRFLLKNGKQIGYSKGEVFSKEMEYFYDPKAKAIRCDSLNGSVVRKKRKDRRGRTRTEVRFQNKKQWSILLPDTKIDHVYAKAGNRLFAGGDSFVAAIDTNLAIKAEEGKTEKKMVPQWSALVKGNVWNIVPADNKLFVVTDEHFIYCFGKPKAGEKYPFEHQRMSNTTSIIKDRWTETVSTLKKSLKISEGYAVVLGVHSGRLIDELLKQTQLRLIVIESDKQKVNQFRKRMTTFGDYGERVSAYVGHVEDHSLPPYLANLIVSEVMPPTEEGSIEHLYRSLRPYGGLFCFLTSEKEHRNYQRIVKNTNIKKASVSRLQNRFTVITRVGQLPGAADWNAQYADAANTIVSRDKLVRAPLGVLWFGGPSNDKILPRHGHGPSPQVAGGRLIIEGADILRAVDVYTGRLLWERELKGVGEYYNITKHFTGAGEVGSNYFTLADSVYVIHRGAILELDATNGKTKQKFPSPPFQKGETTGWGFMTVSDNYLIATSNSIATQKGAIKAAGSRQLFVFHRKTGKKLWSKQAKYNFRHNAIAVAKGKVFCIDNLSTVRLKVLQRRGITFTGNPRLSVWDLETGKDIWSTEKNIFGTFLSYSAKHNVLLQAGSNHRDRAKDESKKGMVAYNGSTGKVLWEDLGAKYAGPCLLWKDKIITNGVSGFQLDLLTGKRNDWTYRRMYGCNTIIGGQNLLTFRSGAAGFCDIENNSGTGNLSGFKSSCTSNLIIADGLLNAPDYTRTCHCSYSNQTSLAFIYMPEAEEWTFNQIQLEEDYIRRLGINFGAPGDRRDNKSTLWIEYPFVGGPTPQVDIKVTGKNYQWFHKHSSAMKGKGLKWVGASGGKGLETIQILLVKKQKTKKKYTVRLYFAEPDNHQNQPSVMNVSLQGDIVLKNFEVQKEANGKNKTIVRQFTDIVVSDLLEIQLQSVTGKTLLSGIEMIAEN